MDNTKVTHYISDGKLITVTTTATPLDYTEGDDSPLDPIIASAMAQHPSHAEWVLNDQIKIAHLARELLKGYTGGTLEQKATNAVTCAVSCLFPDVPPLSIEEVVEIHSKIDLFTPEEKHMIACEVKRNLPYFTGEDSTERATRWAIYVYNRDKWLYEAADVYVEKLLLSDRGKGLVRSRAKYLLTYTQPPYSPEKAVSVALKKYQTDTLGKVAY